MIFFLGRDMANRAIYDTPCQALEYQEISLFLSRNFDRHMPKYASGIYTGPNSSHI